MGVCAWKLNFAFACPSWAGGKAEPAEGELTRLRLEALDLRMEKKLIFSYAKEAVNFGIDKATVKDLV